MLSNLPLRLRLTLPFALAMAVVLAALGVFVYIRVGSTLLSATDRDLGAQATEATSRFGKGEQLLDRDATAPASFAEILSAAGVKQRSEPAGLATVLGPADVAAVLAGRQLRRSVSVTGRTGRWRLLAVPVKEESVREVLVVGSSLRVSDRSLERLRHELLFSSPLALLLATLAGYLLAGAALRPVEAMRRKAAAISAATPGSRLPVPRSQDEISRLAETLNEMLDRLETAFEHERRFVADASHELRTPLALLRTELELALRQPRSHEELEDALRSAFEETERLTSLAADLLLIASADQHALKIVHEQVSAQALLAAVADRFSVRAREARRAVTVRAGGDLVFAADRNRLEQALGNLVQNALVHGKGAVTLEARLASGRVELHVRDEGSGFPPGFAPHAFDRFSRADEARRRSGSGLGLAIVHAIAVAHGGGAGVESLPGGGADVWISVPAAQRPAERKGSYRPLGAVLRRPRPPARARRAPPD